MSGLNLRYSPPNSVISPLYPSLYTAFAGGRQLPLAPQANTISI
ncbi:hypothetical protein OROMI_026650 [Orobanche minor]